MLMSNKSNSNWNDKTVLVGCDHAALEMKSDIKELLESKAVTVEDIGTFSSDSCNYSDIALDLAEKVIKMKARGVLICGTGIGMSIAANKVKGIRAAVIFDDFTAQMSREHNNANVICIGARTTKSEAAKKLVSIWLDTDFGGGRHANRVEIINDYDEGR